MTSSISSLSNAPLPPEPALSNLPVLAKQMQSQIGQLIQHLNELTSNQAPGNRGDFLSAIAQNVASLNQTVDKTLKLRGS
jgi:ABC-type transporter Mla subunit MlaD